MRQQYTLFKRLHVVTFILQRYFIVYTDDYVSNTESAFPACCVHIPNVVFTIPKQPSTTISVLSFTILYRILIFQYQQVSSIFKLMFFYVIHIQIIVNEISNIFINGLNNSIYHKY